MNRNEKINVDDLRLVALKYYSRENNGVELTDALSYAFIIKNGNGYINPFSVEDNYPLLEALPYSNVNCRSHWQDYGFKLRLVCGEAESGPCYVSYNNSLKDIFDSQFVTLKTLEKYILESSYYFKDRSQIVIKNLKRYPLFVLTINKDNEQRRKMNYYFAERGIELQKK